MAIQLVQCDGSDEWILWDDAEDWSNSCGWSDGLNGRDPLPEAAEDPVAYMKAYRRGKKAYDHYDGGNYPENLRFMID